MNKHLLYIFSLSFIYLACAKEAQVDNGLIESLLLEDQLEHANHDSITNGVVNKSTNESNSTSFQNLEEFNYNTSSNLINEGKTTSVVNKENATQIEQLATKQSTKKEGSSIETSNNKITIGDTAIKNTKEGGSDFNSIPKENQVDSESEQIILSNKFIINKPLVAINKSSDSIYQLKIPEVVIDTIRLDEVRLYKDLRALNNSYAVDVYKTEEKALSKNSGDKENLSKINESSISETMSTNDNRRSVKDTSVNNNQDKIANNSNGLDKVSSDSIYPGESQIRYRTEFNEPEITPLFTDPSAHNRRLKKASVSTVNKQSPPKRLVQQVEKIQKNSVVDTNESAKSENSKLNGSQYNTLGANKIAENKTKKVNNFKRDNVVSISQTQKKPLKNTSIITLQSNLNNYNANRLLLDDLNVRLLRKESEYQTNKNYSLLFEVVNKGEPIDMVNMDMMLPENWKIISISDLGTINTNERKIGVVSFYIPAQSPSGIASLSLQLKTRNYIINEYDIELKVANNYALEVFNIYAPQQVQAGELITSTFGIINKGNIEQEVIVSSSSTIKGDSKIIIPKDSTVIVELEQKTNAKANAIRKISTSLQVLSQASQRKFYNSQNIEVIPTKIKQKDPFFRYPVQASLYFNSHTKENDHYSTISAELRGNGYVDVEKNHHLNFILRAPKKTNIRRFSVVDQYSLIYRYKDRTVLHLGDHSYFINKLGFGSRYGLGFKIDHNIKKWTLSAFYSRPRLYNFNREPLYGVRAVYRESDSLNIGVTLERSHGNTYFYRNSYNQDGRGQILTFDYDYTNKNTRVEAEVSASVNKNTYDFAADLNFVQNFKNFTFSSYVILAGKDYLGNISNSVQISNNLYYTRKGFNFGVGHAVSRVNRRLDPILFEVEPYYEAYFATLGYRFSNKHYFNLRFDKRVREDQLEPKSYHYDEYGLSYNFNYFNKLFTGSFGGRLAKTQNMLTELQNYRNTYSNHLNVAYKIFKGFQIRGGLNYLYTNRYGSVDETTNYLRYTLGFNYNLMRRLSFNMNYNSGYSPEETYRRREYINLNIRANFNRHHRLEIRANYFENPAVVNNKELFAYAKYTYSFGVGLKRLFEQGGVEGYVFTKYDDIDIKGVKLYTSGKTITTDNYGNFELNNLELGTNYIYLDEATLPMNVVSKSKNPIKVVVEKDKKTVLDLELVKAGSLFGNLVLQNKELAIEDNLESYLKLENDSFTYYAEARSDGSFSFQNIVPGDYTFTLIRFKNNGKLFSLIKETNITVKEEVDTELKIAVRGKERKIKFKDTNLKVGYND